MACALRPTSCSRNTERLIPGAEELPPPPATTCPIPTEFADLEGRRLVLVSEIDQRSSVGRGDDQADHRRHDDQGTAPARGVVGLGPCVGARAHVQLQHHARANTTRPTGAIGCLLYRLLLHHLRRIAMNPVAHGRLRDAVTTRSLDYPPLRLPHSGPTSASLPCTSAASAASAVHLRSLPSSSSLGRAPTLTSSGFQASISVEATAARG